MKSWINNYAFLILLFAVMAEYLHLLFTGVIHSFYMRNGVETVIYLDDMIYYFLNEGFIVFIVYILLLKTENKASKCIILGVLLWFLIEWTEITLQLLKIDESRLFINDGSWLQLSTCLTIVLLVYFGKRKLS